MIVSCPNCGRRNAADASIRDVTCDCGHRFDPAVRPTVADPFLGQTVGGYRVEELIGTGGMGTVYRATQLSLGRAVALKVLPLHVAEDPRFVGRFHREAEVLAGLAHSGIVQVFDRGEALGRYYIAMEYVDGSSLRERLRRGPLPVAEACRIASAVLAALGHAHRHGVVHRDVKPENVLVARDGRVKVADFGLSRVVDAGAATRLTHSRIVLGTYEYLAPEQREGSADADPRSDLYSAAVTLYEMLTGELPIGRFELPSARRPGIDRRLDGIVARGLAKDPSARFGSADEMARALDALATEPAAPVDLDALRAAATRFAGRVHARARGLWRRHRGGLRLPASFEARLDLLLTVLVLFGIALACLGGALAVGGRPQGLLVLAHGALLWRYGERARTFQPGAFPALLVLTALAVPTIVGLPLAVWTWMTLLDPRMRRYTRARRRGLDAPDAAADAQGMPVSWRAWACGLARRRRRTHRRRHVALVLACIAAGGWIAWSIVAIEGMAWRDEGAFLLWFAVLFSLAAAFLRPSRAAPRA